jgi:hypothetical protein
MIIFLVTPAVRIARPYYRRHKEALDAAMIEPTAPAQITVLTPSITIRLLLVPVGWPRNAKALGAG